MKPDSKRAKLIRVMHQTAGCRLDDAAACADVAIREFREERYEAIAACVALGVPVRKVAAKFGISYPRVIQIARQVNGGAPPLPDTSSTLSPAA
jgi:hypothetical protein